MKTWKQNHNLAFALGLVTKRLINLLTDTSHILNPRIQRDHPTWHLLFLLAREVKGAREATQKAKGDQHPRIYSNQWPIGSYLNMVMCLGMKRRFRILIMIFQQRQQRESTIFKKLIRYHVTNTQKDRIFIINLQISNRNKQNANAHFRSLRWFQSTKMKYDASKMIGPITKIVRQPLKNVLISQLHNF